LDGGQRGRSGRARCLEAAHLAGRHQGLPSE
jgi:hypothetical protein